ncbi:MAG: DNA repair protein RecN [Fibrobacterales bacterium]
MLVELKIKNLVLIEELTLNFRNGLVAVTGETGAGKSIFLSSLKLLSGIKASNQMIRQGTDKTTVEGTFNISDFPEIKTYLKAIAIDEDDEIIIHREIFANGKSKARINGTLVNLGDLQKLGPQLIQLHGQSEQTLLKDIKTHIDVLDNYGQHSPLIERYGSEYRTVQKIQRKLDDLSAQVKSLAEQEDFLKFQLKELDDADIKDNEDIEIESILSELGNFEDISRLKNDSEYLLDTAQESVLSKLSSLQQMIIKLDGFSDNFSETPQLIQSLIEGAEELKIKLQSVNVTSEYSPSQIDTFNSRLSKIQRLQRKFKTDVSGLIELREKRRIEIESISNQEVSFKDLEFEIIEKKKILTALALKISNARKKSAKQLDSEIQGNLNSLGMEGATFLTQIVDSDTFGPHGKDTVEFYISPNVGEGAKPLKSTLSGGELSRFMLSLKSALAQRDKVPVLVFDEVDSGIGGNIAHHIAECLNTLGLYHQVFAITHLHQIAGKARHQIQVKKQTIDSRTHTTVVTLTKEERIEEIARMMGGQDSEAIRGHAEELIEKAV